MLQIVLAGLVINKVLTLKQAERVFSSLSGKMAPDSVGGCVKEIKLEIKNSLKESK